MSSADAIAAIEASLRDGAAAVDGHFDPEGAAAAIASGEACWLRAVPTTEVEPGAEWGPAPATAVWLRIEPGSRALRAAGDGTADPGTPREVEILIETAGWGTEAAPIPKSIARVILRTSSGRLDLGAAIADDAPRARAVVAPLATSAAAALGVPAVGLDGDAAPPAEPTSPATSSTSVDARRLIRFTLGWEGQRLVLRDLVSPGPRASVAIWASIAVASGVAAIATGAWLAPAVQTGAPWTTIALRAGMTVVFVLGCFTFFHVARHAHRYRAVGAPIAFFGDDRVVVRPWVRRDGAIDPRPEGRFGAGVRAAEVQRVHVVTRDGASVVSLDTEHGPIDVAAADDPAQAQVLRAAVERALAGVASPKKRRPAPARGAAREGAATA